MMKGKQEKAVIALMASLAKTLGLVEWTIQLSGKQPEDRDAFAQVEVAKYRRIATVFLCDEFDKMGHKDILHVLLHEIIHLYFEEIRNQTEDLVEQDVLGVESFNIFIGSMHMHEEMAVDRMASAWATVMWEWESVHKALRKITKQVERTAD